MINALDGALRQEDDYGSDPIVNKIGLFEARLSNSALDPVGGGTNNTIFLHPYKGKLISLYDTSGLSWKCFHLNSPINITTVGSTAFLPYDVFIFDSTGTLTLEAVPWTDAANRATPLVDKDGVKVKSGELNKRYVGTYFTSDGNNTEVSPLIDQSYTGSFNDQIGYCGITNYYNSIDFSIRKKDVETTFNFLQNGDALFSPQSTISLLFGASAPDYSKFAYASTGLRDFSISYNVNVGAIRPSAYSYVAAAIHNTFTVPTNLWDATVIGFTADTVYANGGNLTLTAEYLPLSGYNEIATFGLIPDASLARGSFGSTLYLKTKY